MSRYFIDTDDSDVLIVDDAGQELSDDDAARNVALASLTDMANATMPDGDRRVLSASVRDEGGIVLYRATLSLIGGWLVERGPKPVQPEPGAAAAEPSPEG